MLIFDQQKEWNSLPPSLMLSDMPASGGYIVTMFKQWFSQLRSRFGGFYMCSELIQYFDSIFLLWDLMLYNVMHSQVTNSTTMPEIAFTGDIVSDFIIDENNVWRLESKGSHSEGKTHLLKLNDCCFCSKYRVLSIFFYCIYQFSFVLFSFL